MPRPEAPRSFPRNAHRDAGRHDRREPERNRTSLEGIVPPASISPDDRRTRFGLSKSLRRPCPRSVHQTSDSSAQAGRRSRQGTCWSERPDRYISTSFDASPNRSCRLRTGPVDSTDLPFSRDRQPLHAVFSFRCLERMQLDTPPTSSRPRRLVPLFGTLATVPATCSFPSEHRARAVGTEQMFVSAIWAIAPQRLGTARSPAAATS